MDGPTELSLQDYINWLQRFIIVHSYIYYELNGNVISDKQYDEFARELVMYKNDYPEEWRNSQYYKQFGDDYKGETGFTLYYDLNDHQQSIIRCIAHFIFQQ